MKTMLVGYTGFVGSNLSCQYDFTERYNSKNIEDAYGSKPDLLIYAGIRAEKYLANQDPNKDLRNIENAFLFEGWNAPVYSISKLKDFPFSLNIQQYLICMLRMDLI